MSSQVKRIYVDLPEVASLVTLATATIQKLVRENLFPKPRQLSGRRVAWLLREIEEWAESRPVSDLPPPPNTDRTSEKNNHPQH
jgi:prophage regulatory protein